MSDDFSSFDDEPKEEEPTNEWTSDSSGTGSAGSGTSSQNNQMAVISVVSAAVAWGVGGLGSCVTAIVFAPLALCTAAIFLIGSIVAVVTGHMARRQIKESGEEGDNLAMVGLVLGWIGLVLNMLGLCLIVASIFGLTLLGPEIGNVFSEVIRELETPVP